MPRLQKLMMIVVLCIPFQALATQSALLCHDSPAALQRALRRAQACQACFRYAPYRSRGIPQPNTTYPDCMEIRDVRQISPMVEYQDQQDGDRRVCVTVVAGSINYDPEARRCP